MNLQAIVEIDLHNMNTEDAKARIEQALKSAGSGVYRIRLIHGYRGGTRIRSMIRQEFNPGLEPKVLRIEGGANEGITELVLRN